MLALLFSQALLSDFTRLLSRDSTRLLRRAPIWLSSCSSVWLFSAVDVSYLSVPPLPERLRLRLSPRRSRLLSTSPSPSPVPAASACLEASSSVVATQLGRALACHCRLAVWLLAALSRNYSRRRRSFSRSNVKDPPPVWPALFRFARRRVISLVVFPWELPASLCPCPYTLFCILGAVFSPVDSCVQCARCSSVLSLIVEFLVASQCLPPLAFFRPYSGLFCAPPWCSVMECPPGCFPWQFTVSYRSC